MILTFRAEVINGIGMHVELFVPGRSDLLQAPDDWPPRLERGSLNVRVTTDGYPTSFAERGLSPRATSLDSGLFAPAFELAQSEFGNNQLRPEPGNPRKGSGQVWRATLEAAGQRIRCWLLRRSGSGLWRDLEIVSEVRLRTTYGIGTGDPGAVHLHGGWR